MSKKLKKIKRVPLNMSLQFFIVFCIAVIASIFAVTVSILLMNEIIKERVENSEYIEQNIKSKVDEFQQYVYANDLSTKNLDKVATWVQNEGNVVLAIRYDGNIIYDSTNFRFHIMDNKDENNIYIIKFSDRETEVALYEFIELKYYAIANIISLFVGVIVFLLICTAFIHQKVKYITLLDREVNCLEGGDLSRGLTIKGRDELTYLAKSIDDMRLSIINKQKEEAQALFARHKLVTTMSHDLRTPLTVLIGFLEIIDNKKYKDEKELEEYISKAKEKSYRIKELSNKLFEYFFAFNIKETELKKETFNTEVINTMIEDYIFSLCEKGYTVENKLSLFDKKIEIDINLFSRVIDNVFSNILKYADKEKNIEIENFIENNFLRITFSNMILPKAYKEESTNIGLELCTKIITQHNGRFEYMETEDKFIVDIFIPLCKAA